MKNTSRYIAKIPDESGHILYTDEEHAVWDTLFARQCCIIQDRACDEFLEGIEALRLSGDKIPQCNDINSRLQTLTGWSIAPVPALISFQTFFELLAQRIFPAASFIRRKEDLDYLQEPDIFHEIFGHCAMLAHPAFADFTHTVGQFGLQLSKDDRVILARLYWFTVEFGLIQSTDGLRIYGGGILSSKEETIYALESNIPKRNAFDLLTILRTPYRYDEKQLSYFIINKFDDLYKLVYQDKLLQAFEQVKKLGLLPNLHDQNGHKGEQPICNAP